MKFEEEIRIIINISKFKIENECLLTKDLIFNKEVSNFNFYVCKIIFHRKIIVKKQEILSKSKTRIRNRIKY